MSPGLIPSRNLRLALFSVLAILFILGMICLSDLLYPLEYIIVVKPDSFNETFSNGINWPDQDEQNFTITNLGKDLHNIIISVQTNDSRASILLGTPTNISEIKTGERNTIQAFFSNPKQEGNYSGKIIICSDELNKSIDVKLSVVSKSSADAWIKKANALMQLGIYEKAIQSYNESILLNPKSRSSWLGKGDALIKLGKIDDAYKSYAMAADLEPQNAEDWYRQANLLWALDRGHEAETALKKARELGYKQT